MQVVLDVSSASLAASYQAGDEIAVYASNPASVVRDMGSALGVTELDDMFLLQDQSARIARFDQHAEPVDEDEDVKRKQALLLDHLPLPNTYHHILTHYLALEDTVSYSAMCALALLVPQDGAIAQLAGSRDAYEAWASQKHLTAWQDVFEAFPSLRGHLGFGHLVQLAPLIRPRHYSISSTMSAEPGACVITVSKLTYTLPNGTNRAGFCSAFITSRQPGDSMEFRIVPTPGFRMVPNSMSPLVMVGAGTGIAPFRGFWWERLMRLRRLKVCIVCFVDACTEVILSSVYI